MQLSTLQRRSFAVRYLTLFGGETFSKLCVMAAFAYLARTLTPGEYGIVEWALSATVFFALGVESGMGLYGARVVAGAPERIPQLVPQVMLLRAILGVPAFALILVMAARYQSAGLGILAVNGIAVLLTPFLTQWVFQGLRQMQWVAAGTALRNFVFVGLVLLTVRPGSDIRLVAIAEVTGIAVLGLLNAFVLHRLLHVRLDWRGLLGGTQRLFRDVWYMGLSDFMWACLWYSPVLIVRWVGQDGSEQVAWLASAIRIVLALHTFVFLYFFNLLPNLVKELSVSVGGWRDVVERSVATSMWPACLIAVGGTLIAPVFIPAVYGVPFEAAVRPFQIAIWMIPVAWFSGHFRFSLIAAGHQRWELVASAATAFVTVGAGLFLSHHQDSQGAASALLLGGTFNAVVAVVLSRRMIGAVRVVRAVGPALLTTAICLVLGAAVAIAAGVVAGALAGCVLFVLVASWQDNDLVRLVRGRFQR